MLSFFRFIGDLKSISSGYERIIANRTPPRVSTTYKTPNRTPTLLRPSVPSGNHCGSVVCIPSSLPTTMYVVWVFVRRVCVCRKFTTRRGNSLAACSVLWHARDGTLAGLGRGESPLSTNGVDSEKMVRFRRKPYGDTGDCTWSCASLNDLHAAAQAGGRAGGRAACVSRHISPVAQPNTASVCYLLNTAFALVVLCLPPGSACAMCEFEVTSD